LDTLCSEIAAGRYHYPYDVADVGGERCLLFQPRHAIDHLAREPGLRERWNALPVKSPGVFRRQLAAARVMLGAGEAVPVLARDRLDRLLPDRSVAGSCGQCRVQNLVAARLDALHGYGLDVPTPP